MANNLQLLQSCRTGGWQHQDHTTKVAPPTTCPIQPRNLTVTQAQWLKENLNAQRTFLSAYTTSVMNNGDLFRGVHSLHIGKINSGLLDMLMLREFWNSMIGLDTLTLMVIPDWRQEYVPGDKNYRLNMTINPVGAASKLYKFLAQFIAPIENLCNLTVGYVGGGEHATGMYARNTNVLPAPISPNPSVWLYPDEVSVQSHTGEKIVPEHIQKTVLVLDHIRNLKFVNYWFTPQMLEIFVNKSQDTSLHHLALESVSLTGDHGETFRLANLNAVDNDLRCLHEEDEWLNEDTSTSASWVNVLDKITPGQTILSHKYETGMIDKHKFPIPESRYRGNLESIELKSCGYVIIDGTDEFDFCQDDVVHHHRDTQLDPGLRAREKSFYLERVYTLPPRAKSMPHHELQDFVLGTAKQEEHALMGAVFIPRGFDFLRRCTHLDDGNLRVEIRVPIMLDTIDPTTRATIIGLGKLTSCIHPIEKRVLERAWGLRFGWGDTMARWAPVEDGCHQGGTGRFSGTIRKYVD